MITIKVEGFEDLLAELAGMERQIPYAVANGLNAVGRLVKDAEVAEMQRVFKAPTPFTLNSLRLTIAKAPRRLQAEVWFKDPTNLGERDHYLLPQVEGGKRQMRPWEKALSRSMYVMPGKYAKDQLDQYGNLGRGKITKMMSAAGGFNETGFKMNRTRKTTPKDLVVIRKQRGNLKPGVYERAAGAETGGRMARYLAGRGLAQQQRKFMGPIQGGRTTLAMLNARTRAMYPRGLRPLVIFTPTQPTYTKRFDFYGVAQKVVDAQLRPQMLKAIDAEITRELAYLARKGIR